MVEEKKDPRVLLNLINYYCFNKVTACKCFFIKKYNRIITHIIRGILQNDAGALGFQKVRHQKINEPLNSVKPKSQIYCHFVMFPGSK